MASAGGFCLILLEVAAILAVLLLDKVTCEVIGRTFHFDFEDDYWFDLDCNVENSWKSNASWTFDGKMIPEFGNVNQENLELTLARTAKVSGIYECVACNLSSCIIDLHVVYVTFESIPKYFLINTTKIIRCELSHFLEARNVSHSLSWIKNTDGPGFVVDKFEDTRLYNGSNDLLLNPVSYSDEGEYFCNVTSDLFGSQLEEQFYVYVHKYETERHRFEDEYIFVFKEIGDTVEFHIKKKYSQPVWTWNDEPLNVTGWSCRLENLTAANNGVYKAEFQSETVASSFRFWLAVGSLFKKSSTQHTIARLKSNVEFLQLQCESIFMDYNHLDYEVTWSENFPDYEEINSHEVTWSGNGLKYVERSYKHGFYLTFWNDGEDVSDLEYNCTVKTKMFKPVSETMLIASKGTEEHFPPNIEEYNEETHQQVSVGEEVFFSCKANGVPKPNITWKKDGESIQLKTGKIDLWNWTLELTNVTENDTGEYECQVCNEVGCATFTRWLLVGHMAERFQQQYALVNSDAVITCTTKMHSFIRKIKWTVNNGNLVPRPLENFTILDYTGRMNKLHFKNVTHNDTNLYVCRIDSDFGPFERMINFTVVDELPKPNRVPIDLSIPLTVLVVTLCVILAVIYFRWRREMSHWVKRITLLETDPALAGDESKFLMPDVHIEEERMESPQQYKYQFPLDEKWEIPRPVLGESLGQGQFGTVVSAEHDGNRVAVKQLQENHCTDDDVKGFYGELEIMKRVGEHRNIIRLHGCCSQGGPLLIVIEYAPHGSLLQFLLKHSLQQKFSSDYQQVKETLSVDQLVGLGRQVAEGMEYLASIKYVHRDLAARNVLVFDDDVVKISDFGLSRNLQRKDYYRSKALAPLPVRWMAPESLDRDFYTSKSDVWSYGVLCWEVMTLGREPCREWTEDISILLKQGKRLDQPEMCPTDVYRLMKRCWSYDPDERPNFGEIVGQFKLFDLDVTAMEPADEADVGEGTNDDECFESESD